MFKLIIQDDEGKTTVVPLIRDEITIGRKEGNTIRLTERNVSRRHARLVKNNGSVLIEDLDSYNGIRVNGTRIQGRVPVAETDRIQIGDYLLELKADRANANGGTATPFDDQRTMPMERTDAPTQPMPASPTVPTGPPPHMPVPGTLAKTLDPNGPPMALPEDPTKPNTARAPAAAEATPAAALGAAAEPVGRLVCLSTNFAGKEWNVDKAAMVIGRTDDNDIVVNHRSISRHHAKIVREHGRFAIVDLQSSNGVRVNGEEYGKVELRRGDLVDLGHVRLRFVEPGEDFVFSRDGTVVDLAAEAGRKNRLPIFLALGALAIGAVVVMFVLGGGDKDKQPPETAAGKGPGSGQVVTPPAAKPDAAPVGIDPGSGSGTGPGSGSAVEPAGGELGAKIAAAKDAVLGEDWSGALAAADAALRLDPANEEAKRLADQARRESAAQTVFEELQAALKAKKVEEAAKLYAKLPANSVYKVKAGELLESPLDAWMREQTIAADKLADAGKCDKIGPIVRRVNDVAPDRVDSVETIQARCVAQARAPKDPPPRDPPPRDPPPKDPPPKDPPPKDPPVQVDAAKADALYAEAKQAWINGQWGVAIKKAEEALAADPSHQGAAQVGGLSACKLKKVDVARKFAGRLSGSRKSLVRQTCQQDGVEL